MGTQSNIEALKAMGYKEPECNVADLYDTPDNHKTKAKILPIFSVTHRCLLKPYGDEEMKCSACGYITFRDDTKTTQEIIEQMIKAGYDTPDCSKLQVAR